MTEEEMWAMAARTLCRAGHLTLNNLTLYNAGAPVDAHSCNFGNDAEHRQYFGVGE